MLTSIRGTRSSAGFTLVELAAVLFVLGLVALLAIPRLAGFGEPDRSGVFREMALDSEEAFDRALFEKKETRLVLRPSDGSWRFVRADLPVPESPDPAIHRFPSSLALVALTVDGEQRPLDIPTEIRYRPGGLLPDATLVFRERGSDGRELPWSLRFSPADGSVTVIEGG